MTIHSLNKKDIHFKTQKRLTKLYSNTQKINKNLEMLEGILRTWQIMQMAKKELV